MKKEEYRKILIEYRLEQAKEALKDAEILLSKGSPRGVINRAYYAMFYSLLALVTELGKGSSKHSGIIAIFDRYFVKEGKFPKEMSKSIHKAFKLRQISDYRELIEITQEDAKEILNKAKEFVFNIRKYFDKKL